MSRLKVVWLCHFSNPEIRSKLPLSKYRIQNSIRKLLSKKEFKGYKDFAPWISNLIIEFEKLKDVELHIIAPHKGLNKLFTDFKIRNIHYYFFKPDLPVININLRDIIYFGKHPLYLSNRIIIGRYIRKIDPDIINLIGAENSYYSLSALDVRRIPVYVSCQTIYSNPIRKTMGSTIIPYEWNVEKKIHEKNKYFGCQGRMHYDVLLKNNPKAIVFKMFFPYKIPKVVHGVQKKYDFVFFAGLSKKKGVEDLIEAFTLVKDYKGKVTLNIVGSSSKEYEDYLRNKTKELGLNKNIIFHGYFSSHEELHKHIIKSRIAVLPVKLDIIPSSIIEAIYLGLPTITYKTTGTPYLNKDGEAVLISDIGDIEMLAKNMILLLDKPELGQVLNRNALKLVKKEFDNSHSASRLANNYMAVLDHYHHNIPIPDEQIFDINEFPKY